MTTPITPITERMLTGIILSTGQHDTPGEGMCLLEAVAHLTGEDFSDAPACVSPVLAAYGRRLNDILAHTQRQALVAYIPRLPGTAGDGLDETRGYLALDWLTRTYAPAWLRLVPTLVADADVLARHAPITDRASLAHIGAVVRAVAARAAAARDAAAAAAWDYAVDATRAAAWDAARAAAWDYAWDAAVDAARATAWDATRAAARAALAPTVSHLQASAIALYGDLITAGGESR